MENMLEKIFDMQAELNRRIGRDNVKLSLEGSDKERIKWFLDFSRALLHEQIEAENWLNWKWWAKKENNWKQVELELVDMLHFWVSMCQVAGMDAEKVYELYTAKNNLNHKRQELGYKEGTYNKINQNGKEDNEALL